MQQFLQWAGVILITDSCGFRQFAKMGVNEDYIFLSSGQNKNIVCLPKRDRPKKNPAESNSFFAVKFRFFLFPDFQRVRGFRIKY